MNIMWKEMQKKGPVDCENIDEAIQVLNEMKI